MSLLNFVVSDGVNMIATRYVSHESESAASLYYAEGSAFQREGHGSGERPQSANPGAASNAASARDTAVTGQAQQLLTATPDELPNLLTMLTNMPASRSQAPLRCCLTRLCARSGKDHLVLLSQSSSQDVFGVGLLACLIHRKVSVCTSRAKGRFDGLSV